MLRKKSSHAYCVESFDKYDNERLAIQTYCENGRINFAMQALNAKNTRRVKRAAIRLAAALG